MNIQQLIKEKFGTEAAFARAIGWSRQKMNRILHKKTEIKVDDIVVFSRALDCSADDVVHFFAN